MTAVEVCPICDIAGCRHIRERKAKMTHPTDEELDMLVARLKEPWNQRQSRRVAEEFDAADAITTIRTQLAEANARANLAEAALAAQIEADARLAEKRYERCERDNVGPCYLRKCAIGAVIRSQPHDRTALDRMLAEAREKALREAADEMEDERAKQAILALIEKP